MGGCCHGCPAPGGTVLLAPESWDWSGTQRRQRLTTSFAVQGPIWPGQSDVECHCDSRSQLILGPGLGEDACSVVPGVHCARDVPSPGQVACSAARARNASCVPSASTACLFKAPRSGRLQRSESKEGKLCTICQYRLPVQRAGPAGHWERGPSAVCLPEVATCRAAYNLAHLCGSALGVYDCYALCGLMHQHSQLCLTPGRCSPAGSWHAIPLSLSPLRLPPT